MSLQWSDDLSVGNELIDAQHRELFTRFEAFIEACNRKRGAEELKVLFDFLDSYVKTHFAEEESLMAAHNFPGYSAHVEQHQRFIAKLAGLRGDLDTAGPTVGVLVMTSKALVYWLTEHIRQIDPQLATFLKGAGRG